MTTLPYIPDDVPALALSFEWYSKAWWPRIQLEEFAKTYGKLSHADTMKLIDESSAAVAKGIALVRHYGRSIRGFAELSRSIARLWNARIQELRQTSPS